MAYRKKLPIGVDNFEKLIQEDFFYVDKTGMIAELLKNWSEVNLFTRPRRFGKSLNMSMLKTFFEIGCDKTLFQGLKISEEKDVLSHCDNLRADPDARPEDYWSNTSGNAIVRRFIDLANGRTKDEIERLIGGEMILKEINQELTYGELDACPDSYADYHTAEGNL